MLHCRTYSGRILNSPHACFVFAFSQIVLQLRAAVWKFSSKSPGLSVESNFHSALLLLLFLLSSRFKHCRLKDCVIRRDDYLKSPKNSRLTKTTRPNGSDNQRSRSHDKLSWKGRHHIRITGRVLDALCRCLLHSQLGEIERRRSSGGIMGKLYLHQSFRR